MSEPNAPKNARAVPALLAVIAVLLFANLFRPAFIETPARAQDRQGGAPNSGVQMVADNGTVYIYENGKMSVYILETPGTKPLIEKLVGGPATMRRLVSSQDLNAAAPPPPASAP